jgi:hypothetical protein
MLVIAPPIPTRRLGLGRPSIRSRSAAIAAVASSTVAALTAPIEAEPFREIERLRRGG